MSVVAGTINRARLTADADGTERIIASGVDDLGLLADRVCLQRSGATAQVAAYNAAPGTVGSQLVADNAATPADTARQIPDLTIRNIAAGTGTVTRDLQGQNLLDELASVLLPAGLVPRITRERTETSVTLWFDIDVPDTAGEFTISQLTGSGGELLLERTAPEATHLYGLGDPGGNTLPADRPVVDVTQPDVFWGRRIEKAVDERSSTPAEMTIKLSEEITMQGSSDSIRVTPDSTYGNPPKIGDLLVVRTRIGRLERQITQIRTNWTPDLVSSEIATGRPPDSEGQELTPIVKAMRKIFTRLGRQERR